MNGHIRVDIGVRQSEFFLPWMKLVYPSAIGKYGNKVMVLEGSEVVFSQAGHVKDEDKPVGDLTLDEETEM